MAEVTRNVTSYPTPPSIAPVHPRACSRISRRPRPAVVCWRVSALAC